MSFKIITGMSGAGKSNMVQVLEDLNYYCVDNLPPNLFVKFSELVSQSQSDFENVALVADVRGGKFFSDLHDVLEDLKAQGVAFEIIFLEASDEVLVRRYKETRRRHPLSYAGSVLDGIQEERKRLQIIRNMADVIIDTSKMKVQEFKVEVASHLDENYVNLLNVSVMSFGFKHGLPIDADLVVDVRFLPNPFYIPELKTETGLSQAVQEYVYNQDVTKNFVSKYSQLILDILPEYKKEGKKHLVIAIGCTGGQHRSVAIAEKLYEIINDAKVENTKLENINVKVAHRDMKKNLAEVISRNN